MKKTLLSAVLVIVSIVLTNRVYGQGTYNMCTATTSTTDSTGTLYDSGGPTGNYQDDEDCTFLIAPTCATSITLTFHSFNSEFNYDSVHVFDGPTTASPEVMFGNDTTLTANPVTCTSGYMLVVWHSDVTVNREGFHATWTSIKATGPPVANFTSNTTNAPFNTNVQFTDLSSGTPSGWIWYFGDGDTAMSKNPTHAYSTPGNYLVTLVSTNSVSCNYADTVSHFIDVQGPPQIEVSPLAGFNANVACGDSATFTLNVRNIAGGQLVYTTDGSSVGKIKVLIMTYGINQFTGTANLKAAIHHYFNNDTIVETNTTVPGTLSNMLSGMNVLLIPEQETGDPDVWTPLGPVIRQFVNNGGSVIFCGSYSSETNCMFNLGIFSGTYVENAQNNTVHATTLTDSLTIGLTNANFQAPEATWVINISNTDKVTVVNYQGNDVVSYRIYGSGKAIFVAFDYYDRNDQSDQIIANAVKWAGENALPPWIHMNLTTDTVDAGDTSHVAVSLVANGIPAGTYYANIGIGSNDPLTPLVIVPCTLTVSGLPIIGLSQTCLDFGQVMQHTTVRDTFDIVNNGCDTLFLNSILSTNPAFTVSGNVPFLLPGAFAGIVVTLHDTVVHISTGNINIDNNDVDTLVCLTANISPAPKVTTSQPSITQDIRACYDSVSATFTISNTAVAGAVPLTYTLGSLPAWVSASPTSGSIAPGASNTITLSFGSDTLAGDTLSTNLVITSNDPQTPNKNMLITLHIDFNPCVHYVVNSSTCTGISNFTSFSVNTPTSYHWDFGDGDTSNVPNPIHPYAHNGTYNTTLIACNAHGCDTSTQAVNAIITGPKAISCYPQTTNYVGGIGIRLFQVSDLFGFRFNKSSPDAVDGYKDYSCTDNATLLTRYPYTIHVTTGLVYVETVRAWLDMNNDAILDDATERIYSSDSALTNHDGSFFLPDLPTNVYNEPLRLRIASDYSGNPIPLPCLDLQFGQVEDYSVFLQFYDGVNEVNLENSFRVYPNPFNSSATIEYNLKKSSEVSVEVFNLIGEKISNFTSSENQPAGKYTYEFTKQPSGVYFVKLTVDGKSSVKKIIKI